MLKKLLILLTIAITILPILASPVPVRAIEIDWSAVLPGDDPGKQPLIDFCKRRQGNQMNLETWYSGRCNPKEDTFAGDQVGFADIFILDVFERVNGPDDGSTSSTDKLKNIITFHNSLFGHSSTNNLAQTTSKLKNNGLISQAARLLGTTLSTPPASTSNYIASIKQNLHRHKIVPEAIAANEGFGFNSFAPILPVWKAFRNIAYLIFVIIFIVIGFAIMFRVKINPQTVIGIQTILPKIIALLLLITFSYAIVGLMIDLMYLVFYLVINAFKTFDIIRSGSIFDQPIGVLIASGQWGLIMSMIYQQIIASFVVPSAVTAAVFGLPIGLTGVLDFLLTVSGIGLIIRIILMFAILYTFFKLFIKLLGAYISIVIQLIFAPIILIAGVFPGSETIGNWFRKLLANMSVFPVTMIFLLLSYVFMVQPIINSVLLGWASPILGVKDLVTGGNYNSGVLNAPLIFAGSPGAANILALLGIGLLLMASQYVDMVRDALKVPPFKYGAAIGEALQYGWYQAGNESSMWRRSTPGKATMDYADSRWRAILNRSNQASTPITDAGKTMGGDFSGDKATPILPATPPGRTK